MTQPVSFRIDTEQESLISFQTQVDHPVRAVMPETGAAEKVVVVEGGEGGGGNSQNNEEAATKYTEP